MSTIAVQPEEKWYKVINKQQRAVLIASCCGWMLDSFDLMIFSFTMAAIMAEFHSNPGMMGLIATIGMFAAAFGGFAIGALSDRIGRVKAMTTTILLYSLGSLACGFSQDYWQLLALRAVVGVGLGGQWTAGAALISETWPKEHRGKALGIMQSSYAAGSVLAALVASPIIMAFGWRWLYIIGVLPALLLFYIGKHVKEPEIWQRQNKMETDCGTKSSRVLEIFKKGNFGKLFLGTIFAGFIMLATIPVGVWLPMYIGTPVSNGGAGVTGVSISLMTFPFYFGMILGTLSFGFLSDKYGRKNVFKIYLLFAFITWVLMVYIAPISKIAYLVLSPISGFLGIASYAGLGMVLSEMFRTRIRATAMGFCYNIARIFGGIYITLMGVLLPVFGLKNLLVFLGIFFLCAFVTAFFLKETVGIELEE